MASASADLGKLRWSSKPVQSRERKRISTRNIIPLVNTFRALNYSRESSYPKRRRPSMISYPKGGVCGERRSRICALAALSTYNDKKIKKGPKFELVKPLRCRVVHVLGVFHCNFIAKPTGGSKEDEKLFFAEVQLDLWQEEQARGDEIILTGSEGRHIIILGPPDSKKGLDTCGTCLSGHVLHPTGVRYREHYVWPFKC